MVLPVQTATQIICDVGKRKDQTPIERFPAKPQADGRFHKRIKGKLYCFGRDGDREAALREYDRIKHALYEGRAPAPRPEEVETITLKWLANRFINERRADRDAGRITAKHFRQIEKEVPRFVRRIGGTRIWIELGIDDFAGYVRHLHRSGIKGHAFNKAIAIIRNLFNHAYLSGWITRPVNMGRDFKRIPQHQIERRKRTLAAGQIKQLLDGAKIQLRAMILLGLNCGFGPTDCGRLTRKSVDLAGAWVSFRRPKTRIERDCPLWLETVAALRTVMLKRRNDQLVFRTRTGNPWSDESVGKAFRKLVRDLKLDIPLGVGLYAMRHTFATLARDMKDVDGYKRIMGRKLGEGIDSAYIETVPRWRLEAITNHVRSSLNVGHVVVSHGGNEPPDISRTT